MADIASKIAELLNNPDIMDQIKNFSNLVDKQESGEDTPNENRNKTEKDSEKVHEHVNEFSPEVLEIVAKLMPILSSMKKDDKYTKFLTSLRPLLSEKRKKKLDESSKILKLIQILPVLKNNNIL